jgi:hypothetical protein
MCALFSRFAPPRTCGALLTHTSVHSSAAIIFLFVLPTRTYLLYSYSYSYRTPSMAEDRNAAFLNLAGSKLRSRLSCNLNESASAGVTSKFARKQLEKLGWKEGEGLGKRRDGISTHIRVQKRADEKGGLGKSSVDENLKIGNEWWKDSVGDTLARLSNKKKSKKNKKRKKTFTDEELFEATGGSRFGMRAQAPQKGKWQRAETIVDEEEQKAKDSVEWNGMTTPKIILSEPKKKKRKIEAEDETEEKKKGKEDKKKGKEEKKKRKEAKKKKKIEKKSKKETDD